jgi:hypothetical protein
LSLDICRTWYTIPQSMVRAYPPPSRVSFFHFVLLLFLQQITLNMRSILTEWFHVHNIILALGTVCLRSFKKLIMLYNSNFISINKQLYLSLPWCHHPTLCISESDYFTQLMQWILQYFDFAGILWTEWIPYYFLLCLGLRHLYYKSYNLGSQQF